MLNNIVCKNLFVKKKNVFYFKNCLILVYLFVLLQKKKIKLDLPKNYGASQYIKRLAYIRNKDPNFQNPIIGIVNNKSDF